MLAGSVDHIMEQFAERTGLTGVLPQRRYLWTDAFAVCNYLGLSTVDPAAIPAARALVAAVHGVLGRHRGDDPRQGPLSGLTELEAVVHPTRGGLRIGKPLAERDARDGYDIELEWERDGQYFHYLTRWMHALDQLSAVTGDARFNRWAVELAETACGGFDCSDRGGPPLAWKMSVDLSRAQVSTMDVHDPLDGYLTCHQLRQRAHRFAPGSEPPLGLQTERLQSLLTDQDWRTEDPLCLGGLMTDAYRLLQLEQSGAEVSTTLLPELLTAIEWSTGRLSLDGPAERGSSRLPFRELGLAIGLDAMVRFQHQAAPDDSRLEPITGIAATAAPLGEALVGYWRSAGAQLTSTWTTHLDINAVMLATALNPAGYLELRLY